MPVLETIFTILAVIGIVCGPFALSRKEQAQHQQHRTAMQEQSRREHMQYQDTLRRNTWRTM